LLPNACVSGVLMPFKRCWQMRLYTVLIIIDKIK
jgi:hypothetical protein